MKAEQVDLSREHLFAAPGDGRWSSRATWRCCSARRSAARRTTYDSAAQAVALLYRAAGGSSLYERCPLERCFRDVNAALGHVTLQRGILEDAGRVRLGLRPNGPLF
jgi:hypothetical protein